MAWIKIGTKTTDADGKVTFSNLPYGNYKYQQTSAKTGYTADATEYTFNITSTTPFERQRFNAPSEVGALRVIKHNENFPDLKLAGGKFKLTDSADKTMLTLSAATDASGELLLGNLMTITGNPQSYKIVEVEAPIGYELNLTEYENDITVDTTTDQQVPNTPTNTGEIDVILADANYNEYKLEDADYDIFIEVL